ncbi:MAG: hypothetical protein FWE63_06305 [Bacteroidales bacterium]|nr:hypothetical protein [Bacteroidales bacterium]
MKQKVLSNKSELKHIKQEQEPKPTKAMIEKIMNRVSESHIETTKTNAYNLRLSNLNVDMLEKGYFTANEKISNKDMMYIVCFAIDMEVKDISYLFNVEPASIRSVRYRIKKKFGDKNTFKFLI